MFSVRVKVRVRVRVRVWVRAVDMGSRHRAADTGAIQGT